jgi:hypothetical protein
MHTTHTDSPTFHVEQSSKTDLNRKGLQGVYGETQDFSIIHE